MGIKNFAYSFFIFFGFMFLMSFSVEAQAAGNAAAKCGNQCYTYVGNQVVCGNQYCKDTSCTSRGGRINPNPSSKDDRCLFGQADSRVANSNKQQQCSDAGGQWNYSYNACDCDTGSMNKTLKEFTQGGFEKCVKGSAISLQASDEAICSKAGGHFGEDGYADDVCVCNKSEGRTYSIAQLRANPSLTCGNTPSQSSSSSLCEELDRFVAKAQACKDDGGKAVIKCSKDQAKGNDSNFDTAQGVLQAMSQVAMAKGAQAGSAESCFNTGAINAGAFYALNGLKEGCDSQQEQCKAKCELAEDEYGKVYEACHNRFVRQNPMATQDEIMANAKEINDKLYESKKTMDDGVQKCEVESQANEKNLQNLMSNMDRAAKQAAICNCQLTAGGANCPQTPGPADCLKDPTNPLCKNIPPNCTGADRDSKQCICLRDPKAASCVVAGPNTGSQVASAPGFQPISGASPNYKGSTGGGFNIGDLGGDDVGAASSSGDRSGGGDPISAASPSGGGGGGGGSGGGGEKEVAEGEHESKSGIGGLFNQLKTGVSQLFGGGKKDVSANGKTYGDGKNKNGLDPEKWRPKGGLRGIAGGNGIGGRNEDIFKKMNNQYNQQYHTFITGEKSPR